MRLGSVQQLTSHAHKVHSAQLIKSNTISPIASDQEYIDNKKTASTEVPEGNSVS